MVHHKHDSTNYVDYAGDDYMYIWSELLAAADIYSRINHRANPYWGRDKMITIYC